MLKKRFPYENLAVYEIMWKNMVDADRPQMTTRRMRFTRCITKAKTHVYNMSCLLLFHGNHGYANAP